MDNINDFKSWIVFLIIVIIAVVSNVYTCKSNGLKEIDKSSKRK
jgi:hypothetical protein